MPEDLHAQFERFARTEDPQQRQHLQVELEQHFRQMAQLGAEDWHLWGLLWYESDGEDAIVIPQARGKFELALRADPTHWLARLYLAHCLHDQGQWQAALSHYQRVDDAALRTFQTWRYVKWREQMGFCHWQLGETEEAERLFAEVVGWHEQLPAKDVVPAHDLQACLPPDHPLVQRLNQAEDTSRT